jgi:iron-sulfur cluster repair protein YtfE (RIC family)
MERAGAEAEGQMTPLGKLLHAEHLRTLAVLDDLEHRISGKAGDHVIDGAAAAADRTFLETLVATIDRDILDHFAFEEAVVFPLLWECDRDLVTFLTHDHVAVGPLASDVLRMAQEALVRRMDAATWSGFREAAGDLIALEIFHIQKEETGLLSQLPALIDADTDRRLAAARRV